MSRDYSRSRSRSRDRAPEPRWDDQPRRRERQEPRDVRVYVGNLPSDVRERELDDLFYDQRPGKIRVVRSREGGARTFAFVDFRSFHDADDAVYHRDGIKFGGSRIIVEVARGERGGRDGDRDRGRGRDGSGDRERKEKRDSDRKANLAKKRSNFGITVTNIADGTKWQDLKDHFTGATFADVKGSEGVVDFSSAAEAEAAVADKDQSTVKGAVIAVCLRESAAPAPADADADAPADADADADAPAVAAAAAAAADADDDAAPAAAAAAAAVSADANDDDDAGMGPRDAPEAEAEETRRGRSRSGTR